MGVWFNEATFFLNTFRPSGLMVGTTSRNGTTALIHVGGLWQAEGSAHGHDAETCPSASRMIVAM